MADISSITVDSTTYNLKDSTARTSVASCLENEDLVIQRVTAYSGQQISAKGYLSDTVSITKSGYTPIAVAGFTTGTRYVVPNGLYITQGSSPTLTYTVANWNTSAVTSNTLYVYILYMKDK